MRWIAAQANAPATRQEWVDRGSAVATPSLRSHGIYLIFADESGL